MRFAQTAPAVAYAATLLAAAIAAGCSGADPAASAVDASSAAAIEGGTERTGTLSVTALRFTGWHDDSFHYLPALSVSAPATGRPVFVQRVDFTAEEAGTRRLLKGVRYPAARRIQPGGSMELVPATGTSDPVEIDSPLPLGSISAIVFFTDDVGQAGLVSAVARVPDVSDRQSRASLVIRYFTVVCREYQGRFLYWPKLTLAETSADSRASIRKIVFELLDVGAPYAKAAWSPMDVPAGGTLSLVTSRTGQAPWFEIDSSRDARRVSVAISFLDDAGRGGLVSATAPVDRQGPPQR